VEAGGKGVLKMVEQREVKVRVKRFDTEKGNWWAEYKLVVDWYTPMTEVLRRIKVEIDPTLSYRAACHMGVCGSCSMKINGKPRLACKTRAIELLNQTGDEEIVVEPMDYFPTVKDLVVDMSDFCSRMFKVKPRLHPAREVMEGKAEHRLKPEDQRTLWKFGQCIWCGLCVSACPAIEDQDFLGPAAQAKGFRFLADPRDTLTEERAKLLIDSAWRCTYCYQCFEVCPRDIEPVEAVKKTRAMSSLYKGRSEVVRVGVRHSEAVAESIASTGKIMEALVYTKGYGASQAVKDMIFLLASGRGKYLLVKETSVKNIEEVKKIVGGAT